MRYREQYGMPPYEPYKMTTRDKWQLAWNIMRRLAYNSAALLAGMAVGQYLTNHL